MTGLYIHVPFCARKCPYCDFYSVEYSKAAAGQYVDALVRNIRRFAGRDIEVDTVYFGGGTPSLLNVRQVRTVLDTVRECFVLHSPEVTLEANPCTVDLYKLCQMREAGVNRLSFGVQSANDGELERLGRLHDFARAKRAVYDARTAEFENISCDIMLGTPSQTAESLKRSVDTLTSLPITHISAYMLKIEQGTRFDCEQVRKEMADDDAMSDMYLQTVAQLEKAGFAQYEISNFAKSGFESRHNLKYWSGEEYIGIGASAHSFFGGRRYYCPRDVRDFIERDVQQEIVDERSPDALEEYIMLGLRLTQGIGLDRLERLGADCAKILQKARELEKIGLCEVGGGRIRLTVRGFLLSNSVIAEFILLI